MQSKHFGIFYFAVEANDITEEALPILKETSYKF